MTIGHRRGSRALLTAVVVLAAALPGPALVVAAPPSTEWNSVIVMLERAPGNARSGLTKRGHAVHELRERAAKKQGPVLAALRRMAEGGHVSDVQPLWIVNGIAVRADVHALRVLERRTDVEAIVPDVTIAMPPTTDAPLEGSNLTAIGAPQLWAQGVTGSGVTVASLDTGVDSTHPDLATRWNEAAGWFDAYGQHATPVDLAGHGTQTMGVMVAGSASGTSIGVAPGARWITARIFDDGGAASASAIHLAFQWVLDPDGNPATDDAPRVVNSSWSLSLPGCDLTFLPDIQALRAAGILPVFAAGNFGPSGSTSGSPANNPGAISVGAVDGSDAIFSQSSRGPTSCGRETAETFPELSAPGVGILSTERFGLYGTSSGTSLAAPHVSGMLALMASAFPSAPSDLLEDALRRTTTDLGSPGADDAYGAGRLDGPAAFAYLGSIAPEIADLVFADGFETATLERWSRETGSGLAVVPSDEMDGRFSMQLELDGSTPAYLTDKSPAGERSLHVRLHLDPADAVLNGRQYVVLARSPNGSTAFRLELRHAHGSLQLRALTRMQDGALRPTAWAPIAAGAHDIELGWRASTHGGSTGSIVLWVDGVRVAGRWHLAATTGRVSAVSVGSVNRAAVGQELLDGYVSTRGSHIGP